MRMMVVIAPRCEIKAVVERIVKAVTTIRRLDRDTTLKDAWMEMGAPLSKMHG